MVTGCTTASSPETTCGAEFCPASSHTTVCALCSLSESWVATRMRGWRRRLRWRSTAAAPCRSRPRGPSAASPARGRAHLRELSSMSVESVCSSSSRAAPACEQAQSTSLSERGVAIYMYWDVFSEQGAVWQLPPVLRISTALPSALQSLNSAFLHLLRRHGGGFGVRGRVRRSSMYDCSSQRMRRSRRGCRWC